MKQRFLHEAALRLRNDPAFDEFRAWLTEQQNMALGTLATSKEDRTMYFAQGSYNAFQRIKNLIEDAPSVLEKMAR